MYFINPLPLVLARPGWDETCYSNMQKLTEEVSLREKCFVFKNRAEAGKLLARKLLRYKDTNSIVFAIPSGGVPVAAEIAKANAFPLDVIIVRKIQIPHNPEAGFGAVGPDILKPIWFSVLLKTKSWLQLYSLNFISDFIRKPL